MRAKVLFLVGIVISLFLIPGLSMGINIPSEINFQGYLTDETGTPLEGTYTLTFSFWQNSDPDPNNNQKLWEESHVVEVNGGVFNVSLGSKSSFSNNDITFGRPYYLKIEVNGTTLSYDGKLPVLKSVGYSLRAGTYEGRILRFYNEDFDGHTLTSEDDIVFCSGGFSLNLPSASENRGRIFTIKKIDEGGAITINAQEGEYIDEQGKKSVVLDRQFQEVTLISDGDNWYRLGVIERLKSEDIEDGAITTEKLANNAVTYTKIGGTIPYSKLDLSASIVSNDIQDGTIQTQDIADGAITYTKISGTIPYDKLELSGAISSGDLKADSVDSSIIKDGSVDTEDIADGAITEAKIADNAVTYTKIVNGTIRTEDLADNAITSDKIADGAVTSSKLNLTTLEADSATFTSTVKAEGAEFTNLTLSGAVISVTSPGDSRTITIPDATGVVVISDDGTVGTAELADASVTYTKISGTIPYSKLDLTGSISSSDIQDGTIQTQDIADQSITYTKISGTIPYDKLSLSGSIKSQDIQDGSITSEDLAVQSVTEEKLADGAVTYTKIAQDSISSLHIQTGAVTTLEILDQTITSSDISPNAINYTHIADGTIQTEDLADDSITSSKIKDGEITDSDISISAAIQYTKLNLTNSIQGSDIVSDAISTSHIQDNAITSEKIADGAITSSKLNLTTLQADSASFTSTVKAESAEFTNLTLSGAVISVTSPGDSRTITIPNASGVLIISDDGTVGTSQLADASVTYTKISGTIPYSKLDLTGSISSSDIQDGTIQTQDIADQSITYTKISGTIPYSKLDLSNSISLNDLQSDSVDSSKIKDGTIISDDISDGAITEAKLADGAVTYTKIADGTIRTEDLADSSVTYTKIAGTIPYSKLSLSNSITSSDIQTGAIGTAQLAEDAVTYTIIADGTIQTTNIADGAVTYTKLTLADNEIPYTKLNLTGMIKDSDIASDASISYSKLNLTNSIGTGDIANGAIMDEDIALSAGIKYTKLDLAGSIQDTDLKDEAVTTAKIATGAVGTAQLAEDAVTYTIIADGTIQYTNIADGAVTATKLNSISSNGESGQALVSNGNGGFSWYSIPNLTRVLTVGEGGEYTSITAALNAITDYTTTSYLIKVGPGTYNEQIEMKPNVNIEGCGEEITIISYSGGSNEDQAYTVKGASNSEIRFIKINSTSTSNHVLGILCDTVTNFQINNVTIKASTDSGTAKGIWVKDSTVTIKHCKITSGGSTSYGIYVNSANVLTKASIYQSWVSGGSASILQKTDTDTYSTIADLSFNELSYTPTKGSCSGGCDYNCFQNYMVDSTTGDFSSVTCP